MTNLAQIVDFKPGVVIDARGGRRGLTPEGARIIEAYAQARMDLGFPRGTITSVCDGHHGLKSLHWIGDAVDCRTHDLSDAADRRSLLSMMKRQLGPDYDVILEAEGEANEHIHGEYQPKGPPSV